MGQAQRSRTRDSISVISGSSSRSRTGNSTQRRRGGGGERVRQCSKNSGGLENLELWEISRQPGSSRMMRLADQEQVRYGQRRACANLRTSAGERIIRVRSVPQDGVRQESADLIFTVFPFFLSLECA